MQLTRRLTPTQPPPGSYADVCRRLALAARELADAKQAREAAEGDPIAWLKADRLVRYLDEHVLGLAELKHRMAAHRRRLARDEALRTGSVLRMRNADSRIF